MQKTNSEDDITNFKSKLKEVKLKDLQFVHICHTYQILQLQKKMDLKNQ